MTQSLIFKGRGLVKGVVEGIALVSKECISFVGDIDPQSGIIVRKGHELEGCSIAGKILIFPSGRGSVGSSSILYYLSKKGNAPLAMVNTKIDPPIVFGALLTSIPLVYVKDDRVFDLVKTGDKVRIDANLGMIKKY